MWSYSHRNEKYKEIEINNQFANSVFPININDKEAIIELFFKFCNPKVINLLLIDSNEYITHLFEKKDENFRHIVIIIIFILIQKKYRNYLLLQNQVSYLKSK